MSISTLERPKLTEIHNISGDPVSIDRMYDLRRGNNEKVREYATGCLERAKSLVTSEGFVSATMRETDLDIYDTATRYFLDRVVKNIPNDDRHSKIRQPISALTLSLSQAVDAMVADSVWSKQFPTKSTPLVSTLVEEYTNNRSEMRHAIISWQANMTRAIYALGDLSLDGQTVTQLLFGHAHKIASKYVGDFSTAEESLNRLGSAIYGAVKSAKELRNQGSIVATAPVKWDEKYCTDLVAIGDNHLNLVQVKSSIRPDEYGEDFIMLPSLEFARSERGGVKELQDYEKQARLASLLIEQNPDIDITPIWCNVANAAQTEEGWQKMLSS